MPIYEYRCAACGHHEDALQKLTDPPLRKCSACGKSKLQRLVSAPQFRLKGSGWYETDFKSDGEKKRNLVEKSGEESSPSSSGADSAADKPAKESAPAAEKPKAKPKPVAKPAAKKKPAAKPRAAKA